MVVYFSERGEKIYHFYMFPFSSPSGIGVATKIPFSFPFKTFIIIVEEAKERASE